MSVPVAHAYVHNPHVSTVTVISVSVELKFVLCFLSVDDGWLDADQFESREMNNRLNSKSV